MFDSLDNGIVIRFASYLHSQDLVSLSLTCRRFGSSKNEELSLMENTAMQIINNSHTEREKHCQNWLIKHILNYTQSWKSIENQGCLIS